MTRGTERDEPTAVEALYDAFAPSLYRYAWSLLSVDGHQTAEAVHDGLVAGVVLEARRTDPADRGPWLYALVRSACQRRGLAQASPYSGLATVPAEEPAARMFSRLPASHRELVELNLRHALPNSAVARILGLDPQICGELSRSAIRRAAENLAGGTSSGGPDPRDEPDGPPDPPSPETNPLDNSGNHGGPGSAGWRTQVHGVTAALSLLRPPGPPPELRDRVVRTCLEPALAKTRERIAAGMHPLTGEGYPLHRARVPREPGDTPEVPGPEPEQLPRALPGDRLTTRDHAAHEEAVTPLAGPDPDDGPGGRATRRRWPLPAVSGLATVAVAVVLWSWASAVGGPSTVIGTGPADAGHGPLASDAEKTATASDAKPEAGPATPAPTAPPEQPEQEAPAEAEPEDGAGQESPSSDPGGADPSPRSDAQDPSPGDGRSDGEAQEDDGAPGDQPEEGGSNDGGDRGLLHGLLGLLFGGG